MDLIGLFLAAFAAATVVPAQSESVLVALLLAGDRSAMLLLGVATAGNVLGAVVNWGLGRFLTRFVDRHWFPVTAQSLHRSQDRYARYGWPSLLLSWVPVIGDPITIAAGLMREPLWRFLIVVTAAKGGRYLVLVSGVAALS
jgi:membrane protein YqaA with SNARE-associated domain